MLLKSRLLFLLVLAAFASTKLIAAQGASVGQFLLSILTAEDYEAELNRTIKDFLYNLDVKKHRAQSQVQESRRNQLYREHLASRVSGSLLREFYGRF